MLERRISEKNDTPELQEKLSAGAVEMFSLSEEERTVLKDRIQKYDGLVRIFVHPYFEREEPADRLLATSGPRIQNLEDGVARLLERLSRETPALIFMEERFRVRDLLKELKEVAKNRVYVVPTMRDQSVPLPFGEPEAYTTEAFEKCWRRFSDLMHSLGVKKIILGGMYFTYDIKGLRHCAGSAARSLENDFEIEISGMSYPHGRREYSGYKSRKMKR